MSHYVKIRKAFTEKHINFGMNNKPCVDSLSSFSRGLRLSFPYLFGIVVCRVDLPSLSEVSPTGG